MLSYLFLTISAFSIVLQNNLLNLIGKKETRNGKIFSYIFLMNFICFLLFAAMALGKGGSLYSIGLGAVFGLVTMLAYFCNLQSLSRGPMHITNLVITSSMVLPTLSGALFFHEPFQPSKLAATAALLVFICISLKKDDSGKGGGAWALFFNSRRKENRQQSLSIREPSSWSRSPQRRIISCLAAASGAMKLAVTSSRKNRSSSGVCRKSRKNRNSS